MLDQIYQDTAHLLRRAGFGATPEEIRTAAGHGLAQTTDALLHPERIADTIDDNALLTRLVSLIPAPQNAAAQAPGYMPLQAIKMWWAHRMIASPHPLVEKMTLFWHGHFTSKLPARQGDDMLRQNQLFRANALGNFRTMTLAVSRDPAMLRYLNGNQNFKEHPNENYGRELMELYTCGIGNYTEDDVKAAARAFSGWNLRGTEFFFNANQHDNTPKTFLGKTGNWNGDDIVDMLVAHPATAKRICTQIFEYLVYPNPEPAVLNTLVQTYYGSGYDIRAIVAQILRSNAFYSPKARYAVIKNPAQYVVGTVKMLGLAPAFDVQPQDITQANDMAANPGGAQPGATATQRIRGQRLGGLAYLPNAMRAMGQDILEPPSVKGWDGGERWINTSTLLARINFGNLMSQSRQAFDGQFLQATAFVQQKGWDAAGYVDYLAETLGPLPLSPQTRQTLINYLNDAGGNALPGGNTSVVQNTDFAAPPATGPLGFARGQRRAAAGGGFGGIGLRRNPNRPGGPVNGPGGFEGRLRGAIPLIMATPEYQVC